MQSLPAEGRVREVEVQVSVPRDRVAAGVFGLLLIVALFAGFIALHFAPAITEPDDNGYFAQATRWVRGGTTWFRSASDAEYIGMHWLWDSTSDTYVSRYPPGLPAFIAVLYQLGGYKVAMLANPILAVGSLIGFYVAARRLVAVPWALAGTALLATNPTFIGHTLAGDSHMAVTFCLVVGTALLLMWQTSGALWQIFLAGLVLGCIPTIRYPDSVVALGVVAFVLGTLWNNARSRNISLAPILGGEGRGEGVRTIERQFASASDRPLTLTLSPDYRGEGTRNPFLHLGFAGFGALIPILPLLVRNQLVLGGFWKTGYALTNEQTGFSFVYFRQHAVQYLQAIQGDGLGIVFALGLVGIAWMLCLRSTRALGAMLALYVVPMLLLYMAYYWAPAGNAAATMRFLLPIFPALLLAGMWMMHTATRNAPRAVLVAIPIVLVGFQLLWGASDTMQRISRMEFSKRALTILTDRTLAVAKRDDVVITSTAFLQHADFVREWKLADLSMLRGRAAFSGPGGGGPGGRMGDPNSPSPMQAEKQQKLRDLYTGTSAQRLGKFAQDVSTWSSAEHSHDGAAHQIYIVCSESELRSTFGRDNPDITLLETIQLPKRPEQPMANRGFGGGPGGGPPGMGGRQGGGGGGPGGGMFGLQNLDGATWVIARWTPARAKSEPTNPSDRAI